MSRAEKTRAAALLARKGLTEHAIKQRLQLKDVVIAKELIETGENDLQFEEGWEHFAKRKDHASGDNRVPTKEVLRRLVVLEHKLRLLQRYPTPARARKVLDLLGYRYDLGDEPQHTDQLATETRTENGKIGRVVPPLPALLRDHLERAVIRIIAADPKRPIPKPEAKRHAWHTRTFHRDLKAIADLATMDPMADIDNVKDAARHLVTYVKAAARPLRPKAGVARNHRPRSQHQRVVRPAIRAS